MWRNSSIVGLLLSAIAFLTALGADHRSPTYDFVYGDPLGPQLPLDLHRSLVPRARIR